MFNLALLATASAAMHWEQQAGRCPYSTKMEVTAGDVSVDIHSVRFGASFEQHSSWGRSKPISFSTVDSCASGLGLNSTHTGIELRVSAEPDPTQLPHALFRLRAFDTEGSKNRCIHGVSVPRDGRVHTVVVPFAAFECVHVRVGGKDPVRNFLSPSTVQRVGVQMAFGAEGGSHFLLHSIRGTAGAASKPAQGPRCCASAGCQTCHAQRALAATPDQFCRSFPEVCQMYYDSAASAVTCESGGLSPEELRRLVSKEPRSACKDLSKGVLQEPGSVVLATPALAAEPVPAFEPALPAEPALPVEALAVEWAPETTVKVNTASAVDGREPSHAYLEDDFDPGFMNLGSLAPLAVVAMLLH